jgi:DNA ligase (NAD+)
LSKDVPFERVLFALGIRFVGETVAKKLAFAFRSIDAIASASFEELISTDEIGDKIAHSIQLYFSEIRNQQLIARLKEFGLNFESTQKELSSNALEGLVFVVSGVFSTYSRDEIKQLIEENGGKNASSISSKTAYVVAGENMGPSKLEKATSLGIKIISENDLILMITSNK